MIRTYYPFDRVQGKTTWISIRDYERTQDHERRVNVRESDTSAMETAAAQWGNKIRRGRQVMNLKLELRGRVNYFFRSAQRGLPGFLETRNVLCRYLSKDITAVELCELVNGELAKFPVFWAISAHAGGRRSRDNFTLDKDGSGALNSWRVLAQLIESGATLERFRICQDPDCGVLFWDSSQNGKRKFCTDKHKWKVLSRRYRTTVKYQETKRSRRDSAPGPNQY